MNSQVAVSTEPSDYAPTDHFLIRWKWECGRPAATRTNPPITPEVVRECITGGTVRDAEDDCKKFVAEVDGHTWHLVFNDDRVVTAFVAGQHVGLDGSGGTDAHR